MNKSVIDQLLDTHVTLQLGTYFDRITELKCGAKFASSDTIKDFYWNYAYNIEASADNLPNVINEIRNFCDSISRACVLYTIKQEASLNILDTLAIKDSEEELWMIYDSPSAPEIKNNDLKITTITNSQPSEDVLDVFKDAYGSGPVDAPGYTGLPDEYIDAMERCMPKKEGVKVAHFIGKLQDRNVSISSVFYRPPYAGLYNVGTIHDARRIGCAWDISTAAINHAIEAGCSTIFLQTQDGSEVEALYKKMGFRRGFVGSFLTI